MPFNIPDRDDVIDENSFLNNDEARALSIGIAVGFVSITPVPKTREFVYEVVGLVDENGDIDSRTKAMKEAKKESSYAAMGVVSGAVLGAIIFILAGIGVIAAPEAFDATIAEWGEALV